MYVYMVGRLRTWNPHRIFICLSVKLPVVAPVVPNSAHKSDESAATPTTGEAVKAAATGSEMAKASTKAKEPKAAGHQDIQLSDDSESEVPIHT